jgi:hypothetical protein
MRYILLVLLTLSLTGCMSYMGYQASNIEEWAIQTKALDASGCIYFRGNSRPYADVSMLFIGTYGKGAPKYLDCLQAIPENARSLVAP